MSTFFGPLITIVLAFGAVFALFRVAVNDGDAFGDARVRVRLLRLPSATDAAGAATMEGSALHAELEVDNPNDSPVMVSARVRPASVVALLFVEPHGRRTALRHRDRLTQDHELLGAVAGRGVQRFLLPVDQAVVARPKPGARTRTRSRTRALRVTAVVDQIGRRTRVISNTVRLSGALDGVLPAASDLLPDWPGR